MKVFIAAEVGCQHDGDPRKLEKMIDAASMCGVDAVKLQKRIPRLTLEPEKYVEPYESPESFGPTYGAHREHLEFDEMQWRRLIDHAKAVAQVELFASVFEPTSVRFMHDLGVSRAKIGSGQIGREDLLREVSQHQFGQVYLSTGMCDFETLDKAVEVLGKNSPLTLVHATSAYPCTVENCNLGLLAELSKRYALPVGWSSHWPSPGLDSAAVALGAVYIEHHFTLDRYGRGSDQSSSLEPNELRRCVRDIRAAEDGLAAPAKKILACESACRSKHRKGLVCRS